MSADVINNTTEMLDNIQCTVEARHNDGTLLYQETLPAMISPLLPGQLAPVYFDFVVDPGRAQMGEYAISRRVEPTYYPTLEDTQAQWHLLSQQHRLEGDTLVVTGEAQNLAQEARDLRLVVVVRDDDLPRGLCRQAAYAVITHVEPGANTPFELRMELLNKDKYHHHELTLLTNR